MKRRFELRIIGRGIGLGGEDAGRLLAHEAQDRRIRRGAVAEQRHVLLQTVFAILLDEAHRVRAGEAHIDRIDVLGLADLRQVRRVVGRVERRPQLFDDLAAGILEDALKAGNRLVPIGEIIGDGDDALVVQRLGGVVGHGVAVLRRGAEHAHHPRIGLALRQILGRRHRQRRHLRLADVVVDGVGLEGGERAEDGVDMVALDQLLRLGLGARGVAAGIAEKDLDLAPGKHAVMLFEADVEPLIHLDAAGGERPGLDREQAQPDRPGILCRRSGRGE